MHPPETPLIQRADPRARRRGIAIVLAATVLTVLGFLALEALIARSVREEAPQMLLAALQWSSLFVLLGVAGFGLYVWRLGTRIHRFERFPPPGMTVIRDTVVLQGAAARRRGRLVQAIGAVLVVLALVALALVIIIVRRLA